MYIRFPIESLRSLISQFHEVVQRYEKYIKLEPKCKMFPTMSSRTNFRLIFPVSKQIQYSSLRGTFETSRSSRCEYSFRHSCRGISRAARNGGREFYLKIPTNSYQKTSLITSSLSQARRHNISPRLIRSFFFSTERVREREKSEFSFDWQHRFEVTSEVSLVTDSRLRLFSLCRAKTEKDATGEGREGEGERGRECISRGMMQQWAAWRKSLTGNLLK